MFRVGTAGPPVDAGGVSGTTGEAVALVRTRGLKTRLNVNQSSNFWIDDNCSFIRVPLTARRTLGANIHV